MCLLIAATHFPPSKFSWHSLRYGCCDGILINLLFTAYDKVIARKPLDNLALSSINNAYYSRIRMIIKDRTPWSSW